MAAKSPYSVHPSVAYIQNILAKFKAKTGRTVDEWVAFTKKEGPKTEVERRRWLKETADVDDFVKKWLQAAYENR